MFDLFNQNKTREGGHRLLNMVLIVALLATMLLGGLSLTSSTKAGATSGWGPGIGNGGLYGYNSGAYSIFDQSSGIQRYGWCVLPSAANPPLEPAENFVTGLFPAGSSISDNTKMAFIQWFWTVHSGGWNGYSTDQLAAAIAQIAYTNAGGPIIGPLPPQALVDGINFEYAVYGGQWTTTVSMPGGALVPGNSYSATVHLGAPSGYGVPGIALNITGQSGVSSISWASGSTTDNSGNAVINFIPASGNSSLNISVSPSTFPGVYGLYFIPANGQAATGLQNLLADYTYNYGQSAQNGSGTAAIDPLWTGYINKVDGNGNNIAGAVFDIKDVTTNTLMASITTSTTPVQIPFTLDSSHSYQAIETQAPPGYYIPANHTTTLVPPSSGNTATFNIGDPLLPTPTLTTTASKNVVNVGTSVTDSITVGGNDGESGTIVATLYGPVTPINNSCSSVSWNTAPTAHTQSLAIVGSNNAYTTANYTIPKNSPGCYSWGERLTLSPSSTTATSNRGLPAETVLATTPAIVTSASALAVVAGNNLLDTITVSSNQGESGTISATLYGPATPVNGSCDGVDWTSIPHATPISVAVDGSVMSGNGNFVASTPAPISFSSPGCYSWADTLTLNPSGDIATSVVGQMAETTLVTLPSIVTTASSSQITTGNSLSDSIVVSNNQGEDGTITSTLYGPVPSVNSSCSSVGWANAPVANTQTVSVPGGTTNGNGTFLTAAVPVSAPGCYSWAESLILTPSKATAIEPVGNPNETTNVFTPPSVTTTTSTASIIGSGALSDTVFISSFPNAATVVSKDSLIGPVAPNNGSCSGLNWVGAQVVGTAPDANVNPNSSYVTPPINVSAPGCYTWAQVTMINGMPYALELGSSSETTLVSSAPSPNTIQSGMAKFSMSARWPLLTGSGGILALLAAVIAISVMSVKRRRN